MKHEIQFALQDNYSVVIVVMWPGGSVACLWLDRFILSTVASLTLECFHPPKPLSIKNKVRVLALQEAMTNREGWKQAVLPYISNIN